MKRLIQATILTATVAIASSCTYLTPTVQAVGVKIAPAYKYVDLYIGQVLEIPVRIYNTATVPLDFHVELADFGALDDHGGPLIKTDDSRSRFGLRQAALVTPEQITVPPGGSSEVKVVVRDSYDFDSGGHYGAVLFKLVSRPGQRTVSVDQTLSSLLFVTKKGGDMARLQMKEFTSSHSSTSLPQKLEVVVGNNGNTQGEPEGTVKLIDPFGRTLYSQPVNPQNGVVLPDTARRFTLDSSSTGAAWPGLYQATLTGNFGTSTHTFWLFPPISIAAVLVLIGASGFGYWRLSHWYRRQRKHGVAQPVKTAAKKVKHTVRRHVVKHSQAIRRRTRQSSAATASSDASHEVVTKKSTAAHKDRVQVEAKPSKRPKRPSRRKKTTKP